MRGATNSFAAAFLRRSARAYMCAASGTSARASRKSGAWKLTNRVLWGPLGTLAEPDLDLAPVAVSDHGQGHRFARLAVRYCPRHVFRIPHGPSIDRDDHVAALPEPRIAGGPP